MSFKVSDATPLAGKRIKVSGVVKPARDGRRVLIQKRLRNGKYCTVATAKLKHSSAASPPSRAPEGQLRRRAADQDRRRRRALCRSYSKTRKIRVEHP